MRRKRAARFVYNGLGFPIELRNVVLVRPRDKWAPEIDLGTLEAGAFRALATKPARLTGNEVHFIRQFMGMTLKEFAKHLRITHPTVMNWESAYRKPTGMGWPAEEALRMKVLKAAGLGARRFFDAHSELQRLTLEPDGGLLMVYDPEDRALAEVGFEPVTAARR